MDNVDIGFGLFLGVMLSVILWLLGAMSYGEGYKAGIAASCPNAAKLAGVRELLHE